MELSDTETALNEIMHLAMEMAALYRDVPAGFPKNSLAEYDKKKATLREYARAILAAHEAKKQQDHLTQPFVVRTEPGEEVESNPMGGVILRGEAASKFREAMDATDGVEGGDGLCPSCGYEHWCREHGECYRTRGVQEVPRG